MKTQNRFHALVLIGFYTVLLTSLGATGAQVFSGNNLPGDGTAFTLDLSSGATNLSLVVSNTSSAYSHLLLKQGGTPTAMDFDLISRRDGKANQINLQAPEFVPGSYGLLVSTPVSSVAHPFILTLSTNRTDLRQDEYPVLKPMAFTTTGTVTNNQWHYYQVDITNGSPGWRIVLASTGALTPNLYVRRDNLPTISGYHKRAIDLAANTIVFTEADLSTGTYFIGVHLPVGAASPAEYTLEAESGYMRSLSWDPGLTHMGTEVYANTHTNGGDLYFRITTQNTTVGAWRTALKVTSGEADVYLRRSTFSDNPINYTYKSSRVGSDGFVLHTSQFAAAQDWYLLVRATPGSEWTLVSGEAHVLDLGDLADDGSSDSGPVEMGPEGMRFFRTSTTLDTYAWRLWLNGATNEILVKKTAVPHPLSSSTSDLRQSAQMLVVPEYLIRGDSYFVGVPGEPGQVLNLDSRIHRFADINFDSALNLNVTGYGYVTYRVQVPVEQIAWMIAVIPSLGDANVSVRRDLIPNEFNNDAFSEVPGLVTDSFTLVPPNLSDGTFFITVYGRAPYDCSLSNGNPEITDVDFVSTTLNADVNRVGWRYFRVPDIDSQLGALGWDLVLANQPPGTEIAIRRNAVPSRWNYRLNDNPNVRSDSEVDYSSTRGFLQRPGHQADIWYIGIYHPAVALGAFTLDLDRLEATALTFDNMSLTRASVPAARWQYFRVDVPLGAIGWDVRLINVPNDGGEPRLVVRRDSLPESFSNLGWTYPYRASTWPSGNQWPAGNDWTNLRNSPDGSITQYRRLLAMGMGRPLEPGTYYVGVNNSTELPMTFTVLSRGIGPGMTLPVTPLAFNGGSVTVPALAPREAAYYSVDIPADTPSWKVKLETTSGESMLGVLQVTIPNVAVSSGVMSTSAPGEKMQKVGNEHFVLLPPNNQSNLVAGTYYLTVVSEGHNPDYTYSRIGAGNVSYTITSEGVLPVTDLGALSGPDLMQSDTLEGGEVASYQFTIPPGTLALEVWLENRIGDPRMAMTLGTNAPQPNTASYGNEGGQTSPRWYDETLINLANPEPGIYSVVVHANGSGTTYAAASYDLRVRPVSAATVSFDGGTSAVVDQTPDTWRYFLVEVPPEALGWDVRLVNVSAGLPRLVIRRDLAPQSFSNIGWTYPYRSDDWPSGNQWPANHDWSDRRYNPAGSVDEYGRLMAMGMGRPLEPGSYYVGVINGGTTDPMSYTIQSRGIGAGMTIPVTGVSYVGGSETVNLLPPREAAYFSIEVPVDAPSWQFKLTASEGESMLAVNHGVLPNITPQSTVYNQGGVEIQKEGNEHFALLPSSGNSRVSSGTYYIAAVSEGQLTTNNARIGVIDSTFTFNSVGPLPTTHLGTVSPIDITHNDTLEGGEVTVYRFTVPPATSSLEVRLENRVGNPLMALIAGVDIPTPYSGSYGHQGGQTSGRFTETDLITVANPAAGEFTLIVKASAVSSAHPDASYTVRINAVNTIPLAFDGGSVTINNQAADTWRYFQVEVPPEAEGWDIRLTDVPVDGGLPRLVIRRDELPSSLGNIGWSYPRRTHNWPSGNQWAAAYDWTDRRYSPNGQVDQYGRVFAMGMGRPLEPGTYFVGVINSSGTDTMTYTIMSRGIGDGYAIPVTPLDYAGGTDSHPGLAPREAAYYRVSVPSNSPSWKVSLTAGSGEVMLVPNHLVLPNIEPESKVFDWGGLEIQKTGNEHFLLLPVNGQTVISGGDYYLAAISEGNDVTNNNRIGVDVSSFTITSEGAIPVIDFGLLTDTGAEQPVSLEAGEAAAFRFEIPSDWLGVEVRLDDRVGDPGLAARPGAGLPRPNENSYGNQDGQTTGRLFHDRIITFANPVPGVYAATVKANSVSSTEWPDATATLRVRPSPVTDLNFAANLNGNGLSHEATGLLTENERAFYRVIVPETNEGRIVIGWKLTLSEAVGDAEIRARKDELPSDSLSGMPFADDQAILVAPFLTPGTWYVEVKGQTFTEYTLTSEELLLERPTWDMPEVGQPATTPGLTAPNFGDSGVDPAGAALPGDQGIDLEEGAFHYYAVQVPIDNTGVMRVVLEAISGNPDFYLRYGQPPSLSHGRTGRLSSGSLVERKFTGTATQYANWVSEDSRYEPVLTNGVYYIAIRAGGNSNVRYRLRLYTGTITDLALDGGNAMNQTIAGGDWRYYRVYIPTNAPRQWQVTFNQILGDVVMYVRDTSPPGQGNLLTDYIDWRDDNKNHSAYPTYDLAGTHVIECPPLRPGHTYYLGFRAVNDATFDFSSAVSGDTIDINTIVPFVGGVVDLTLAPNEVIQFRVDVPLDARRWTHYTTNSNNVWIYMDQGSLPTLTYSDHYYRLYGSHTHTRALYGANQWPWYGGYMYFVTVTNTAATPEDFYFRMDGRDCDTDDYDNDGLPDCWELTYWSSIYTYHGNSDPDGDGYTNAEELAMGTNPTVNDRFYLTDSHHLPDGRFQCLFIGQEGINYRVQWSPNLLPGSWSDVTTFLHDTPTRVIIDPGAIGEPYRFYRAVKP